jgi:hypothetical protein
MITVVSGLPRSGTSLMMQMLAAGGMPILTDGRRLPDEDNPRGYLEWEEVKRLPENPALIAQGEGMVVKVISQLLTFLPANHEYRILFMERPLPEILASQDAMLDRRKAAATPSDADMTDAFRQHLREVMELLVDREDFSVCRVGYRRLLANPLQWAQTVQDFLGVNLDVQAMAAQVDPALHRNRG